MKSKKVMAMLLATVVTASAVLTGCGSGSNTGSGTETSTETETETKEDSTDASTETDDGDTAKTGEGGGNTLPIKDPSEGYTFSIFVDGNGDTESLYMFPILEEQTGIKIDLQNYPYEIAQEKFALALSSGDYADCIGGWCLKASDILTYGVDMGVFVPLEDYMTPDTCPILAELLEKPGVREAMTAPDGHIYSIPYVLGAPKVDFNPYINRVWLENLGLEMPKTTAEFKEVLKAFKEQDANGNGDPNDEIPFSADPNNRKLGYMFGYFGESVDYYGLTMHGNELTFAGTSDAFKEAVEFFADLYAEGLVDVEIFTQDLATWKAKGAQDLYGCTIAYGTGDFLPFEAGTQPAFDPLPVLDAENGNKPVWLAHTYGTTVLKNQAVVTDTADDPEVICRWFDNFFRLENSVQAQAGPIGIALYEDGMTEDGLVQYGKYDTSTLSEEEQDRINWSNLWAQSLPKYIPPGYQVKEDVPAWPEKDIVDETYEPYFLEPIPDYWVNLEDAAELSDLQTSLKDYMDQKLAQWISGQADINAEWETYKKDLDKLGIDRYVELRKAALQ